MDPENGDRIMKHNRFYKTTPDHKQLFIQQWLPGDDPSSIVLFVHGLGSHSGRIESWATRFVEKKVAFIAWDQRGHGQSDGRRGTPTKASVLINDLKNLVEYLREEFPGKKIILYGHSMGGSIAINYVISTTYTVEALITTSPWLKMTQPPSETLMRITRSLARIAPGIVISNRLDPNDISREQQVVDAYKNDPLVHDRISMGLFYSMYEAGLNALRNVYKINCPYLIMHGTADRITSHRASTSYVMNTSDRTRLQLWEGAYHELHHEPEKDQVFDYIMGWLREYGFVT